MFIKSLNILTLKKIYTCLVTVIYFSIISNSHAAQASNSNTADVYPPRVKDAFEWQIIIDLSLANEPVLLADVEPNDAWDYFRLGLLLDVSYKGFFLQSNSRRSSTVLTGSEFGYQLMVQNDWQLDVILKAYIEGYEPDVILEYQDQEIPQLTGLEDRDPIGGIALRYSRFFENAIFYIDVAVASADEDNEGEPNHGIIIDSFYSYLIPYRNWDIYLGAGLTYYDQVLMDYTFGIDEHEVTADRAFYRADSSFRTQLEVFAQHPLSQSWSFNTGITQSFYSGDIKQSPLVDKNSLTQIMFGVAYVF